MYVMTLTRAKVIWRWTLCLKTEGSDVHICPFHGGPRPLSNMLLYESTQVTIPSGMSFHPSALAGCMSVTDKTQTDGPCCNICRKGKIADAFTFCDVAE